jgi:hypothetical protein
MHASAQKSLNSLVVNWTPLLVIIILGTPNRYKISLMNSKTLVLMTKFGMSVTDIPILAVLG